MTEIILKVCLCIIAYLVGAINFGRVFAKFKKIDLTKEGSGNPGTMNALRTAGKMVGLFTFIFDVLKGLAFALVGRLVWGMDWCFILGFITVIGHIFPVYTKFKGGKGVATTMGVFCVACPIVGVISLAGLTLFAFVFKYGFIGSVGTISVVAVYTTIAYNTIPYYMALFETKQALIIALVLCWVMWLVVVYKHKGNFIRYFKGQENVLDILGNKTKHAEENAAKAESIDNNVAQESSAKEKSCKCDSNNADIKEKSCKCDSNNADIKENYCKCDSNNADVKENSCKCDKENADNSEPQILSGSSADELMAKKEKNKRKIK